MEQLDWQGFSLPVTHALSILKGRTFYITQWQSEFRHELPGKSDLVQMPGQSNINELLC